MSRILHITASFRSDDQSVSRSLASKIVDKLQAATGADVIIRDLAAAPLPPIDSERFAANLTPSGERSAEQQALAAISDTLVAELIAADRIVIGVPIYNFGAPSTLKTWADMVARAGTTFRYTDTGPEGLLKGKKAYIAIASGGTPVNSDIDFLSPWLVQFLRFLGITDVSIVAADGIMGLDGEDKIRAAHRKVEMLAA